MAWRQAYLATPSGDALGEIDKNIVPQVAAFQPGLGARTRAESGIARTARPFVDLLEQRADLHRGPAFSVRHSAAAAVSCSAKPQSVRFRPWDVMSLY